MSALVPRDTPQAMRGGARGGHNTMRDGTHRGLQASGSHRVCYAIPDRIEVEASDIVITGMVPV